MTETGFRTFGGLLQVAGVLLVAYELDAAIGEYAPMHSAVHRAAERLRRLRSWIVRTYRRLRGHMPQVVTGSANINLGNVTVSAKGMATPGEKAYEDFTTDEERMRHLFDRVNSAHEWVKELGRQRTEDREAARQRMDKLEDRFAESDQAWREKVRELAAGSAGRRFAGFATVGYGVIAATWPVELARWDPPALALLLVAWLSTLAWAWTRPKLPK